MRAVDKARDLRTLTLAIAAGMQAGAATAQTTTDQSPAPNRPAVASAPCANLAGRFAAVGASDWPAALRGRNIIGEVFKYSLPEDIGDLRRYEDILRITSDSFSVTLAADALRFTLYNGKEPVREITVFPSCTASGWQTARDTERYLDGSTIQARFVTSYSIDKDGNLVLKTHVSGVTRGLILTHKRDDATITVTFKPFEVPKGGGAQ